VGIVLDETGVKADGGSVWDLLGPRDNDDEVGERRPFLLVGGCSKDTGEACPLDVERNEVEDPVGCIVDHFKLGKDGLGVRAT
jgi:hypothetical protein